MIDLVSVEDYCLRFKLEISILPAKGQIECKGNLRRWRESEIAALMARIIDSPATSYLVAATARGECSITFGVQ